MAAVELPIEHELSVQTKTVSFFEDSDIKKLVEESKRITKSTGTYNTAKYYKSTQSSYYRYAHHIIFMLYTGIRIGEALALKWGNIDELNQTISIQSNMASSYDRDENGAKTKVSLKEGSTKTKKGVRMIPLSTIALDALKNIKKMRKDVLQQDYVFITSNGIHPTAKSIRRTLNTMQENANTKVRNSGLHVLRHSFASMLIRRNVNIKIVSELLGHSKVSTTYDIYVSLIDEQKFDAINVLNL